MRRLPLLCRTALAGAAATALLTACGGGSDNQAAATGSSAAVSSSPNASAAAADFCSQATSTLNGLAPAFSGGGSDPSKLAPILTKAAGDVAAIRPPAQLEADWAKLARGLDDFAAAYSSAGAQGGAAAASSFEQRNGELIGQLTAAATNVRNYMTANCGLPSTAPGSAAPTG
jgi:hypothetical protein